MIDLEYSIEKKSVNGNRSEKVGVLGCTIG